MEKSKQTNLNQDISLKAKSQALDALLAYFPVNFYWMDNHGYILGVNEAVLQSLNLQSTAEIVGKHSTEIVTKEAWLNTKKAIAENRTIESEEVHIHPDGSKTIFLSIKTPIHDENTGEIAGVVGISINITEQKKLAVQKLDKIQQAKDLAEQKVKVIKVMGGSIAHEIKTPLAAIKLSVQMLRNALPKLFGIKSNKTDSEITAIEKQYDWVIKKLPEIENRINMANVMIALQLQNINMEHIDSSNFSKLSIQAVVSDAIKNFHLPDENVPLVHNNIQQDFLFNGEPTLTRHIIWNLINNALHFIKEVGRGEIEIWTEKTSTTNYLHFKDTAKGISADVLPHIFEQFYSKRTGGTGLGLAFCDIIMKAYGGEIRCESQEGEYTHFILSFPSIAQS